MVKSDDLPRLSGEGGDNDRLLEGRLRSSIAFLGEEDSIDEDEADSEEELKTDDRITQLYNYGLSPLQAKIFVDLLQYGRSKAKDLSKRLDLNRVDVYRILNALKRRGLVEVTVENPALFSSVPPNQAMMILLEEEEEKFRRLRAGAKDILAWLKSIKMRPPPAHVENAPGPTFKMLFGRQLMETWRKMLQQAKHDVIAVWSEYGLSFQSERGFIEPYIGCVERGVMVRVVSIVTQRNLDHAMRYSKIVNLKHNQKSVHSLRYLIVDGKQTSISTNLTSSENADGPLSSIWTDSKAFINVLSKEFEVLWMEGSDITTSVKEFREPLMRD